MAKYFSELGYSVDLVQTDCKIQHEYGLQIPLLGPDKDEPTDLNGTVSFYATPHELVEYVGLVTLSCDLDKREYLNSWFFSGHAIGIGSTQVVQLKGMFTREMIDRLFERLR